MKTNSLSPTGCIWLCATVIFILQCLVNCKDSKSGDAGNHSRDRIALKQYNYEPGRFHILVPTDCEPYIEKEYPEVSFSGCPVKISIAWSFDENYRSLSSYDSVIAAFTDSMYRANPGAKKFADELAATILSADTQTVHSAGVPGREIVMTEKPLGADGELKSLRLETAHKGVFYALNISAIPEKFDQFRAIIDSITSSFTPIW